jgi:hypothetical protein
VVEVCRHLADALLDPAADAKGEQVPLIFRNVDTDPSSPVETWPYEALVTAIERGGLPVWRRIAAAIRTEPWGRVARSVEEYADYAEPTGAVSLLKRAVARARAAAELSERAAVATEVKGVVERPPP